VDRSLRVLEFRGHMAPYIEHAPGEANRDLTKITSNGLAVGIQRLVRKAMGKTDAVHGTVSVLLKDVMRTLDLTVVPIQPDHSAEAQYLVIIQEAPRKVRAAGMKSAGRSPAKTSALLERVKDLEHELGGLASTCRL
jgi:hypothetical protein